MTISYYTASAGDISLNGFYSPQYPFSAEDIEISGRTYYTRSSGGGITKNPCAIFFPGSGHEDWPSTSASHIVKMCSMGFNVLYVTYMATAENETNSTGNFTNGYGNVNAPLYTGSGVYLAAVAQAAIAYANKPSMSSYFETDNVVLIGKSLGATTVLSWSSMINTCEGSTSSVKAMAGLAPARGGDGNSQWNDASRVIAYISNSIASLRHKTFIAAGNDDDFCPPDMLYRYMIASKSGTSNATFFNPGAYGHNNIYTSDAVWTKMREFFSANNVNGLTAV